MKFLGLEYYNSRWRAGGIDGENFPQLLCEGESLESLHALLPDQSCDMIALALPFSVLREEPQLSVSLREEVERTFSGANICVIPREIAASLAELWLRNPNDHDLLPLSEGEHILVCSFGEESSTASIIRRGPEELPLAVTKQCCLPVSTQRIIDALGEALRKSNSSVDSVPSAKINDLRRGISRNLRRAVSGRRIPTAKATWADAQGADAQITLSAELYLDALEPTFADCLQHLIEFLQENPLKLKAVIICGAGADTFGVRENIVEPVLTQVTGADLGSLFGHESSSLPHGEFVIAGATLLAAGQIPFRQQLPYSVGVKMQVEPNGALADLLQLPKDTADLWISPLLPQGTPLPTRFCSEDVGLYSVLAEGEVLDWNLRMDDKKSQIEKHESLDSIATSSTVVNWEVSADSQGVLRSIFKDANSQQIEALTTEWLLSDSQSTKATALPTISPEQLKARIEAQ